MKHDAGEAQRRYRAFTNGLFAATFAAATEQAAQHLDEAEEDVRREYLNALDALRRAMSCFTEPDRRLLALVYRGPPDDDPEARNDRGLALKDASERLGIPYGTARARHARVLKVLHELLLAQGIKRAPRPLVGALHGRRVRRPRAPGQRHGRGGPGRMEAGDGERAGEQRRERGAGLRDGRRAPAAARARRGVAERVQVADPRQTATAPLRAARGRRPAQPPAEGVAPAETTPPAVELPDGLPATKAQRVVLDPELVARWQAEAAAKKKEGP